MTDPYFSDRAAHKLPGGTTTARNSLRRFAARFETVTDEWTYNLRRRWTARQQPFRRARSRSGEEKALANPDNRPPHVFATDGLRSHPAALRELKAEGKMK
jgi:hypothetical protein